MKDELDDVFLDEGQTPEPEDLVLESEPDELAPLERGRTWEVMVSGAPRTKKTSNQIHLTVNKMSILSWIYGLAEIRDPSTAMRAILSRVKVQPSKVWRKWAKDCKVYTVPGTLAPEWPLTSKLHIEAVFYRDRAIGDLLGYMQGVADVLQDREIIANDKQLVCWDGSRLDKSKLRPRIHLTLTELK